MLLLMNRRYECEKGGIIPRSHFNATSGKGAQIAIIQFYEETDEGVKTRYMTVTRKELKELLGIERGTIEII